jgi:serine protease Do/serine protease DegQ
MSDSDAVEVGDFAVAIGNPVGLGHTVTSGIISAVGRSGLGIEEYEDFIQTDASINPGNSGGALINLKGELIGINTAIYSRTGGNIGIGFAIPINMARSVMDQLLEHGEIKRGMLGVQIQDLTPELAEAMDVKVGNGALISSVVDGSAADKAGLKQGDIITALDGTAIDDASSLRNRVGLKRIGDTIKLSVLRDGKALTVKAVIGDMPEAAVATEEELPRLAGAHFGAGMPDNHPLQGKVEGVYITEVDPGSAAWRAGLRPGDVIVSVNKKATKTVKELSKLAGKSNGNLLLYVRRPEGALYIVIG